MLKPSQLKLNNPPSIASISAQWSKLFHMNLNLNFGNAKNIEPSHEFKFQNFKKPANNLSITWESRRFSIYHRSNLEQRWRVNSLLNSVKNDVRGNDHAQMQIILVA